MVSEGNHPVSRSDTMAKASKVWQREQPLDSATNEHLETSVSAKAIRPKRSSFERKKEDCLDVFIEKGGASGIFKEYVFQQHIAPIRNLSFQANNVQLFNSSRSSDQSLIENLYNI
ncbi:hypothetical protein TNCV_124081 [Trichonephila clavipes]|nr:hypothetical protein TNCV_124081 [Trichonephila clavipes]